MEDAMKRSFKRRLKTSGSTVLVFIVMLTAYGTFTVIHNVLRWEIMDNAMVMLWVGVVFLILGGLLATYNLQLHVRGRYRAEWLTEGATKGVMVLIRWCWAIIWAVGAILFFIGALWLARYALSQWK